MTLVCIHPFGNSAIGDEIDNIPDGAIFDTYYFAVKPKPQAKGAKKEDDN